MGNDLFFLTRYDSLRKDIETYFVEQFIIIGLLVSTVGSCVFTVIVFTGVEQKFSDYIPADYATFLYIMILLLSLGTGLTILFYVIMFLVKYLILQPITLIISNVKDTIKNTYILIQSNIKDIETVEEILGKAQMLYRLHEKLIRLNFFIGLLDISFRKGMPLTLEFSLEWMQNILTNLRSDLIFRLREQEKILQGARIKVEENIKGTSELEQVSEIQKLRLDRQIEQFEAMQKTLSRT